MFSRSTASLSRSAPRATAALRQQSVFAASKRSVATSAHEAEYESGESAGIKFANQNAPGLTGSLSVVVKAGSRYQPAEGFADVLEKFAFKSTSKRSQLRITRETELLGGELAASHSRENLVLSAKFLNQDLPYFAELFAEVLQNTRYTQHEVGELVLPQIKFSQDAFNSSAPVQALSQAHTSAFHSGLGSSLVPSLNGPWKKNVQADAVSCFAKCAFNKSGLAIVGSGHNTADLSKWINQFFPSLPATVGTGPYAPKPATESKYFGGESRTASSVGNALVLGFPGSSIAGSKGYNAAYYVLAELLGGQSNIKWSRGTSLLSAIKASVPDVSITTLNNAYSDAGLFTISLSGSASGIAKAGKPVVEAIQKVASGEVAAEEVQRAVSLALFRAVDTDNAERAASQLLNNGKILTLSEVGNSIQNVTAADVQKAAKSLLEGKASVAAVGDLDVLPWANEIGVSV